jgi:hypothetical protein
LSNEFTSIISPPHFKDKVADELKGATQQSRRFLHPRNKVTVCPLTPGLTAKMLPDSGALSS